MNSMQSASILVGPTHSVPSNIRLHELFQAKCRNITDSHKTALIYEEPSSRRVKRMTYLELEEKSNKLARAIMKFIRKESNSDGDFIIAVSMKPSDKLIVTLLAIWKTGSAYLPIDTNSTNRTQHILLEAQPILFITDQKKDNTDISNLINTVNYNKLELELSSYSSSTLQPVETFSTTHSCSVAIVLYTSGSTGIPKGVRLPHKVVMNRLNWQWRTFPFSNTESVCVFKTALTFVDAVSEIWGTLLHADNRALLIIPKDITTDPERLIQTLEFYKVERLVLVPTLLNSILLYLSLSKKQLRASGDMLLKNLKLWVCSGESLPVVLAKQFLKYFDTGYHVLCNFYGSTEVMGDVSYYVISSERHLCFGDKVPIGIPIDNTVLYLLDNNLKPVDVGEIGELYASGCNLATGYVAGRDPDRFIANHLSSDSAMSTLYRTGDYARIQKDTLIYEGRLDSQIKVRGHRVDLAEVQSALNGFTNEIDKSVVLCYKPGDIKQTILAYVKLHKDKYISAADIEANLKLRLPLYAIPQVIVVEEIPLLNNGKVDRQTLLKLYERNKGKFDNKMSGKQLIDYTNVKPEQLSAAKCLFETVCDVLGNSIRNYISVRANFYELGGNSLNCIMTITKLHEKGYSIGITEFIKALTLGTVLDYMTFEREDIKENLLPVNQIKKKKSSEHKYSFEMLTDEHKSHVGRIIADSFYEKADLEQWLKPKPDRETYIKLVKAMWKPLLEKNLSFIVFDNDIKKYVGAAMNFDFHDEPEVIVNNNLVIVFEFLEFLEGPIRNNQLPIGKRQILHSFMMGTAKDLDAAENVQIITCMEEENLRLARRKGFAGVFTTNTNPLTQQLGNDIFKYEILADYQVNQYVAPDGSMPFKEAPDEQRVVCSWKQIT